MNYYCSRKTFGQFYKLSVMCHLISLQRCHVSDLASIIQYEQNKLLNPAQPQTVINVQDLLRSLISIQLKVSMARINSRSEIYFRKSDILNNFLNHQIRQSKHNFYSVTPPIEACCRVQTFYNFSLTFGFKIQFRRKDD